MKGYVMLFRYVTLCYAAFFLACSVQAAEPSPVVPSLVAVAPSLPSKPLTAPQAERLQFDRVPVVDLIAAYYAEIEKVSYVISSEVYQVEDRVGIVFEAKDKKAMRALFLSVLNGAGLLVDRRDGVDYVRRGRAPEIEQEVFVYRPKYRDMTYFSDLLASIFKVGRFTFQRAVSAPPKMADASMSATVQPAQQQRPVDTGTSAYSLQNKSFDVLIFNGPEGEVKRLQSLLAQLDKPEGQVQISAYVYEFSSSDTSKTGLGVVADLMKGDFGVKFNMGAVPGSNFLSFGLSGANGVLNLVAQNLATDGRFKVLSRPYVRVKSGGSARFTSGDEVPVLGAAQMDKNGNPVQSVEYKPSGVILDVLPIVRGESIDLSIDQQLSNFVPTTNGVNNSPTIIKRQVKTSLSTKSGEVLVIGGLVSSRENKDKSRLFGLIPFATSDTSEKAEILVVLEVQRLGVGLDGD